MALRIHHITRYTYEGPVFLEPHHLYFYPSIRPHLRVSDFHIKTLPAPVGLGLRIDGENNYYHQSWFDGETPVFTIEVSMDVEVTPFNPFNFLMEEAPKTPHQEILEHYKKTEPLDSDLILWLLEQSKLCKGDRLNLIIFLNQEIRQHWDHEIRYESNLLSPDECFVTRSGSCRDLSWMLVNMLRYLEIPARFVSGYAFNSELGSGHELHAWVEAWFPGAGWLGFDPSAGLLTDEKYVPVAASYHPANTFPVQGNYRGPGNATLHFDVQISEIS